MLGRAIAESRVEPLAIVVALEISEQLAPGLLAGGEVFPMNELDLECGEEALHRRVVVAAALAAHGLPHAPALQQGPVEAGGIPATTIRVGHESLGWPGAPLGDPR